jgi:septal ring factor EnvC (AmiA/AmiB activator)
MNKIFPFQAPIADPNEQAELGQLRDRVEVLQQQLSASSQQAADARSDLEHRLQEKTKTEAALEAKLSKVTSDLKRVADDNASLSERLAASEKRALADKEEAKRQQQQPNGGHENGSFKHEEVVAGLENKYKAVVEEKEKM